MSDDLTEDIFIGSIVGDNRRLVVHRISPNYYLGDDEVIGEAWQDETGQLCGIGICELMTFGLTQQSMYNNSSISQDQSPLSVLAFRLGLSPFVRIEWQD